MSATAAVRGVLTHRDGVTQQSFSVAVAAEGRQSLRAVMGAVRRLSAEVSSALTGLMEAEKHTHTHHEEEEEEEDDEDDSDEDEATAPPPEPPPKRSKTSGCN